MFKFKSNNKRSDFSTDFKALFRRSKLSLLNLSSPGGMSFPINFYFDVGSLPKKDSPSRKIIKWERYELGENIDYAKKEVSRMLKDKTASHEYIAYEACKLVNDDEVDKYTMYIMLGAEAEDYIFMPGEKLEDLFVYKGIDLTNFEDVKEYSDYILGHEKKKLSFIERIFEKIAQLWKKLTPSIEDDAINRPYMAHFFEAEKKHGLRVANGEIEFQNARTRIGNYWKLALDYYKKGNKGLAYYALGHLVHLVADMHVPAHVHNDIHGPTIFLGKLDSFEEWVKQKDYADIRRSPKKPNITIWDSSDVPNNIMVKIVNLRDCLQKGIGCEEYWGYRGLFGLYSFVYKIANYTYNFRSVDAEGRAIVQKRTGKLDDFECYFQASHLIPRAIGNSAYVILQFRIYTEGVQ